MRRLAFLSILLLSALISKSQGTDTTEIFAIVEKMPEFPGGNGAFSIYIANNIKYPLKARENLTQGKVFVSFVVEKDGSITKTKILRSVSPELDEEALRIINSSPKWKPGSNNGLPVRALFSMPITFRLSVPPDTTSTENKLFLAETQPEYPGGLEALGRFLKKNIHKGDNEGKVKASFIVEKDGSLTDIKVIQSVSEKADAEAIRLLSIMPKWKPGMQGGKSVRVSYAIPINFSSY
jgi:TonB family protein